MGFDEFQGIYTLDQSYWLYDVEIQSGALSLYPNNTWMRTAVGEEPDGQTKWLIDLQSKSLYIGGGGYKNLTTRSIRRNTMILEA